MTFDLSRLDPTKLDTLSDDDLLAAASRVLELQRQDRKENQLLYYRPTMPESEKVLRAMAQTIGVFGGNRSSKTTTCMVKWVALATGMFPEEMRDVFKAQFKGPLRVRMVVESLTATLVPVILPKLQWWQWSGLPPAGGDKGHWGWIPKCCLVDGEWEKSWSATTRILTLLCRDPDNPARVLGRSSVQFMSFDQDSSDFASGDLDICHHDEPPPYAIWRENQARVMSVGGTMMLSMTWPDDPSIPVDWIHDEVFEPGSPGPRKNPAVECFELDTTKNPHLDQAAIAAMASGKDENWRQTRIKGQPIRFSNRIHPLFTDTPLCWCHRCGKVINADGDKCPVCGTVETARFCHVQEFETARAWPTAFVLDPHPRKPHMFGWFQIDPSDDVWMVAEGSVDGDPAEVRAKCDEIEMALGLDVKRRLMDPNMGASPASSQRGVTWRDEFRAAGLDCDLAIDSDVGRGRINEYLKPDRRTDRPRFHVHLRCHETVFQMKRYTWGEFRRRDEKDLKQVPRAKYDDFPTLAKYLMNDDPSFTILRHGAPVLRRAGKRGY